MADTKEPHGEELKEVAEDLKQTAEKVDKLADDIAPEVPFEEPLPDRDGWLDDAVTIDRNTEPEPGSGGAH